MQVSTKKELRDRVVALSQDNERKKLVIISLSDDVETYKRYSDEDSNLKTFWFRLFLLTVCIILILLVFLDV